MLFSYNWLRDLTGGLTAAPDALERLITMTTAECEGVEKTGELLEKACAARVQSVEPIAGSKNVKAVVDARAAGDDRGADCKDEGERTRLAAGDPRGHERPPPLAAGYRRPCARSRSTHDAAVSHPQCARHLTRSTTQLSPRARTEKAIGSMVLGAKPISEKVSRRRS